MKYTETFTTNHYPINTVVEWCSEVCPISGMTLKDVQTNESASDVGCGTAELIIAWHSGEGSWSLMGTSSKFTVLVSVDQQSTKIEVTNKLMQLIDLFGTLERPVLTFISAIKEALNRHLQQQELTTMTPDMIKSKLENIGKLYTTAILSEEEVNAAILEICQEIKTKKMSANSLNEFLFILPDLSEKLPRSDIEILSNLFKFLK